MNKFQVTTILIILTALRDNISNDVIDTIWYNYHGYIDLLDYCNAYYISIE